MEKLSGQTFSTKTGQSMRNESEGGDEEGEGLEQHHLVTVAGGLGVGEGGWGLTGPT